ncbi:MAG: hypothetical protein WAM11_13025 [Cyanobium sp.]
MSPNPPGIPPRSGAPRPLRGIPRSHAYWELKAEQMMNRVFDPEATIEIDGDPAEGAAPEQRRQLLAAAEPSARTTNRSRAQTRTPASSAGAAEAEAVAAEAVAAIAADASRRHDPSVLLVTALAAVCLVSAASAILYVSHWNRLQQSLSQERNLLLVERLRALGPAVSTPLAAPELATPSLPQPNLAPAVSGSAAEGLPPPPPEEPWIQQLSNLPASGTAAAGLLRVPVSPRVAAPAPQAVAAAADPARRAASSPLPQLVGVVGAAGKPASAIFLVGGTSMGVGSGEMIGSSGWRLRSADGETALIERSGELRQVSIINGF